MYTHQVESKSSRGITIVEVLVASIIISLVMAPALYGAVSALSMATAVRDNLAASHLAQEGIEVVRAIRDENWINGLAFNSGIVDGSYNIVWNSRQLLEDTGSPLLIDSNGQYNYTSGTATMFSRRVDVVNVSADQIRITSTVSWVERSSQRSVAVESHLFNWK